MSKVLLSLEANLEWNQGKSQQLYAFTIEGSGCLIDLYNL